MARYGRPEARIHRILDGAAVSRGLTRWRVAAIVALACPLAYLVAAAHPQATPPAPPAAPTAPAPPAPQSPVSPATPDAPAPPVPPSAEARTIRRYMIVSGNSTATRWDSNDASDRFDRDALRARFGQNFAWFRKGGNEYIVTDAGILAELQQADEPQNQVNRMQSDGGKPGQPELRDFSDFSSLPPREANKITQFRLSRIPPGFPYVRLLFTGFRFHHIRPANQHHLRNEAESDSLALRLAGSHFEASPCGLLRTALDSYMSNG